MSLTLRPPQSSDYQTLALWLPDAVACLRWAGPRVLFPFSVAELPALLAVAGGESYCLAEGNAAASAFGQYWVVAPSAVHLGRIIVSPAARGMGVGRALCDQLISRAVQSTGASTVTLRVHRENEAAVTLYSRLGFVPVESESTEEVHYLSVGVNMSTYADTHHQVTASRPMLRAGSLQR